MNENVEGPFYVKIFANAHYWCPNLVKRISSVTSFLFCRKKPGNGLLVGFSSASP